jgi:hypothetical protein
VLISKKSIQKIQNKKQKGTNKMKITKGPRSEQSMYNTNFEYVGPQTAAGTPNVLSNTPDAGKSAEKRTIGDVEMVSLGSESALIPHGSPELPREDSLGLGEPDGAVAEVTIGDKNDAESSRVIKIHEANMANFVTLTNDAKFAIHKTADGTNVRIPVGSSHFVTERVKDITDPSGKATLTRLVGGVPEKGGVLGATREQHEKGTATGPYLVVDVSSKGLMLTAGKNSEVVVTTKESVVNTVDSATAEQIRADIRARIDGAAVVAAANVIAPPTTPNAAPANAVASPSVTSKLNENAVTRLLDKRDARTKETADAKLRAEAAAVVASAEAATVEAQLSQTAVDRENAQANLKSVKKDTRFLAKNRAKNDIRSEERQRAYADIDAAGKRFSRVRKAAAFGKSFSFARNKFATERAKKRGEATSLITAADRNKELLKQDQIAIASAAKNIGTRSARRDVRFDSAVAKAQRAEAADPTKLTPAQQQALIQARRQIVAQQSAQAVRAKRAAAVAANDARLAALRVAP